MKQRTHRLVLTVTFDKPCSRDTAVREVRDNIHGEFFTSEAAFRLVDRCYPDKFRVRSVKGSQRVK